MQVRQARLHLAQLGHHLGQPDVAQLVDDQARLVDGLPDAPDARLVADAVADNLRLGALHLQQPGLGLEPARDQLADAFELLGQQGLAVVLRLQLALEPGRLLTELLDAPLVDGALVGQRDGARLEDALLRGHDLGRLAVVHGLVLQPVGPADGRPVVALGLQPRVERDRRAVLPLQQVEQGARRRVVEDDERLPGGHLVAVGHQDLVDDAPLHVLHGAALGAHADDARRDRGALQRGHRRPRAEAAHEHAHDDQPGGHAGADAHAAAAPGWRLRPGPGDEHGVRRPGGDLFAHGRLVIVLNVRCGGTAGVGPVAINDR